MGWTQHRAHGALKRLMPRISTLAWFQSKIQGVLLLFKLPILTTVLNSQASRDFTVAGPSRKIQLLRDWKIICREETALFMLDTSVERYPSIRREEASNSSRNLSNSRIKASLVTSILMAPGQVPPYWWTAASVVKTTIIFHHSSRIRLAQRAVFTNKMKSEALIRKGAPMPI